MDFDFMRGMSPCFHVNGNNIDVIEKPCDFYDALVLGANSAKSRIALAALYLGTGELETLFVDSLRRALERRLAESELLELDVLLDYVRGQRGETNSLTMLKPLVGFSNKVCISLFRSPMFRGLWKRLLPARSNEILGLFHMKVFVFDNDVIISGANLSDQYFKNRQDRYYKIKGSKNLADYFQGIIKSISLFSYHLQTDGSLVFSPSCAYNPDLQPGLYDTELRNSLLQFTGPYNIPKRENSTPRSTFLAPANFWNYIRQLGLNIKQIDKTNEEDFVELHHHDDRDVEDTFIFPTIQLGCVNIRQDEEVTNMILASFPANSRACVTSGYFNVTDDVTAMIAGGAATFEIITASPGANGFLGSGGFSGYIPQVYCLLVKNFFEVLVKTGRSCKVKLWEYCRKDWTYHAKGIWYYPPNALFPQLTAIGSSNFGMRSMQRDLEAQLYIVTYNEKLMKKMHKEKCLIMNEASLITNETLKEARYTVSAWVTSVIDIVKRYC
ncbi:CDP-diacylglycerol--glycerol-3-phosphate 3-phosphatidyltransferase, mitochondrial isoform X2 [Ciona intestinalis]